jgi:hypothetical protein
MVRGSTRFDYLRDLVTPARPATAWTTCPTTPGTQRVAAYTYLGLGWSPFARHYSGSLVDFLSSGY